MWHGRSWRDAGDDTARGKLALRRGVFRARTLNPVGRHRERRREVRAQTSDYLDGVRDPGGRRRVERNGRCCSNCRRMHGHMRRKVAGLGAVARSVGPPRMIRTPELYPVEESAVPNRA
jgi:hypothetical protein